MDFREMQDRYNAEQRKVTEEKIVVGGLFRTVLTINDGLKFKDGRTNKPKRMIIVGIDKANKTCYGTVLVNTEMSPMSKLSPLYFATQYCLKQEDYPEYLDYDSYVDCGVLFAISFDTLKSGEYYGTLNSDDTTAIFDILETTKAISTKDKKRFNIRRR